jgi:hypothetical protein
VTRTSGEHPPTLVGRLRLATRPGSVRLALLAALITSLVLWISPLTAIHGVESALVLGLVLPLFVAPMGARIALAREEHSLWHVGLVVLRASSLVLAVPLVVLSLGALRARWCTPLEGLAFFALGPGIGVLLSAIMGASIGLALPRPRLATTLAVLAPIALALVGLARFYTTPAIFAYSHFVGYFAGSLYDPDVAIESAYVSFRALSIVWGLGLVLGLRALDHGHRLSLAGARQRPLTAVLALALFAAGIAGEAYGPELGHRSTSESIRQALGASLRGERCTVIVPRELPREQAERLRDDCDFRIDRVEHVLGVTHPGRITAFFFRSTDEKRRLMGASNTYIAKPWRDEVYLQLGADPHPVLFHEIVHVVASATGVGPFRISGSLGGLLPAPGIIEGIAVAIAWDAREGLTPHQWARAMAEIDRAPSLETASGLGFLLQPAGRAYTANGSFVRWILETRGAGAVRTLYRTGSYEAALGMSLGRAEREWRAFLETVPLPEHAIPLAQQRFSQPGIFSQVCPHAIAALEGELSADEEAGDDHGALAVCDRILAIDAAAVRLAPHRVAALAQGGHVDEASAVIDDLVARGDEVPSTLLASTRTELADVLLRRGDLDGARALYEASAEAQLSDDQARQLEVKLLAIARGHATLDPLVEVLVPSPRRAHDGATTVEALARLASSTDDGLGDYLLARQMIFRQRYDLAAPHLAQALARGLPTERIRREARRMDAITRARTGDAAGARTILLDIASHGDPGQQVEAEDWLARLEWQARTGHAPP